MDPAVDKYDALTDEVAVRYDEDRPADTPGAGHRMPPELGTLLADLFTG